MANTLQTSPSTYDHKVLTRGQERGLWVLVFFLFLCSLYREFLFRKAKFRKTAPQRCDDAEEAAYTVSLHLKGHVWTFNELTWVPTILRKCALLPQ